MSWPHALVALGLVLIASLAIAETFPEPSKLPANADLPDPLIMMNGEKVTTKEQWLSKRRPELKALFQHYMYGVIPPPEKISSRVEHSDPKAFGGKATLREIAISFGPPDTPKIHLLLVVPNGRKGPAPVFVGMNFSGNHALVDDPKVHLPAVWMYPGHAGVKDNRATDEGRGKEKDTWALEQSIDRGYAVATFYNGDIDPDRKEKREGIQQFINKTDRPAGDHWGTIAAWVWGVHRAVDYLVTDKDLDPERIAVVGHSRLGKTALLAAAFDDRIALAIPHQAGCGGTGPSRDRIGSAWAKGGKIESVKAINNGFPHWFCDNFKQFNDQPEKLPFDQNCLVAIVAPRPVLFSNAVKDTWANPGGQFEVLKAAEPVYRLLGADGLGAEEMPAVGKLVDSTLGYWIREGEHSMTKEDWKVFLDYADRNLKKK